MLEFYLKCFGSSVIVFLISVIVINAFELYNKTTHTFGFFVGLTTLVSFLLIPVFLIAALWSTK